MSGQSFDYIIVGAGIVGMALASRLKDRFPDRSILIVEKESDVALHASGRNSGVLHAGIYYSADSLKAKFCIAGNRALKSFCQSNKIPVNECGKLIVATKESQLPALQELARRAEANGAGASLISEAEAQKIQPNVRTCGHAIYSPHTAAADPVLVSKVLKEQLLARGIQIGFSTAYLGRTSAGILTSRGEFRANHLINCAGLYADRIAHDFSFGKKYTIIPFKGLYLKYKKNTTDVRTNIYPVPDPRFPFLGVHFTKTAEGVIKIGPTAIPAMWRENYQGLQNFNVGEFCEVALREAALFVSNAFQFRTLAFEEMQKYRRSYFISLAKELLPSIDENGFGDYSRPAIRAQLMNKETLELVQDFIIEGDGGSTHLLNVVSPGWTCSFPFAEYIIENFLKS